MDCNECKCGEHDNYDDDVRRVRVIDENGKVEKRMIATDDGSDKWEAVTLMCASHREMLEQDGYRVVEV